MRYTGLGLQKAVSIFDGGREEKIPVHTLWPFDGVIYPEELLNAGLFLKQLADVIFRNVWAEYRTLLTRSGSSNYYGNTIHGGRLYVFHIAVV